MQAEAEAIREMSETLESAGFKRHQSEAFIQSTALAMKAFAVTPKVLDERLDKLSRELRGEWKQDLGELKELFTEHKIDTNRRLDENKIDTNRRLDENKIDTNRRFDGIDRRLDGIDNTMNDLNKTMNDLNKTVHDDRRVMMQLFMGFTLVILAGLIGAFGFIFASSP